MNCRWFLREKRTDLLWLGVGFVVLQLGLTVSIERWLPQVRDPVFATKESRLRARLAETHDRPLVLVLGSSRAQLGVQAEQLSDESAVVFNFGLPGSGPVMQRVCLQRLLAEGIRPDLIVLEITPPLLGQRDGHPPEEDLLKGELLRPAELAAAHPYYTRTWRLVYPWVLSTAVPAAWRRGELRTELALDAFKPWTGNDEQFKAMDGHGWQPVYLSVTEEQRRRSTALAVAQYYPIIKNFTLAELAVQAMNDLLDLCVRENIPMAVLVMPEASAFRAMYPPTALDQINAYLAEACRSRRVPLIDARTWVSDEHFYDTHHLLPEGAAAFTERFGREALRPLLRDLHR